MTFYSSSEIVGRFFQAFMWNAVSKVRAAVSQTMCQKSWRIFLKCCPVFEMCFVAVLCIFSDILSWFIPRLSAAIRKTLLVSLRFGLGLCCSANAEGACRSSPHCLELQLKIAPLPTPIWVGFFLSFSFMHSVCVWRRLSI